MKLAEINEELNTTKWESQMPLVPLYEVAAGRMFDLRPSEMTPLAKKLAGYTLTQEMAAKAGRWA